MEVMSPPVFVWLMFNVIGFMAIVCLFVIDKDWWTAKEMADTLVFIIGWIISCTLWGAVWILSY